MLGIVVYTIGRQAETYIANHINLLMPDRTVVCTLNPCDSPAWAPSVPVTELYKPRRWMTRVVRACAAMRHSTRVEQLDLARFGFWMTQNRVTVVLSEYLQVALWIADVCRSLKIPLVAHAHGYDVSAQALQKGWDERYRTRLPLLSGIVVVSEAMKRRVVQLGANPDHVHVVPCGTPVRDDREPRRHISGSPYKVVAIGRLIGKKGPIYLLESFRRVTDVADGLELYVIGDGPFQEAMRQYVRAAGLDESVHLLGALPNDQVRQHLREADLFVQHSVTADDGDEEGLPVSILEAMSEAVPVISTRHAGIPEAIHDGDTGVLVAPGDCVGMAREISRLLGDETERRTLAAAGHRFVRERFTLAKELADLRTIVDSYAAS